MVKMQKHQIAEAPAAPAGYAAVRAGIAGLLQTARAQAARSVNALMTASYWEIGRRIVEAEQKGRRRAGYGEQLIKRLSVDLTNEFGRGFGVINLQQMRNFYVNWPSSPINQTLSDKSARTLSGESSKGQTLSGESRKLQTVSAKLRGAGDVPINLAVIASRFPLPWSAYVCLLPVKSAQARHFYETEALRNGWSVRQLDRQIDSQFYECTALSRNKTAMLVKGAAPKSEDAVTPDEAVKDPYVLEFLNLKDEYSETELEDGLIHRLEDFLLELGGDFTFVGRQRRLRIDDTWYRVDLLLFHRRLRCLVIIDLKLGKLTHADAGQMHMYCNYAKAHWSLPGENPPVGLILCAHKGHALARYALDGLPNKVLAAEYQTVLPSEERIARALADTARGLGRRDAVKVADQ